MIAMLAGEAKLAAQDEADRERLDRQLALEGRRSPRGGTGRVRVQINRMTPDDLAALSPAQLASIANRVSEELRRRRGT